MMIVLFRFFSSHLQKDPEFRSIIIGKKALAIHMCAITFTCYVVKCVCVCVCVCVE